MKKTTLPLLLLAAARIAHAIDDGLQPRRLRAAPSSETGCCYRPDGTDAAIGRQTCVAAGYEWAAGHECVPPTPEPGCCFSPRGEGRCDVIFDAGSCGRDQRCEWGSSCADPTPEPGCCYSPRGDDRCDDIFNAYDCDEARRCKWAPGCVHD